MVLVGLFVGALIKPTNLWLLTICSSGLGAAAYKAVHVCPICPVERFLGVPYELWGVASFLTSITALIIFPLGDAALLAVGALAGTAIGFQLNLFLGSAELCAPCAVIALCNGALLSVVLGRLGLQSRLAPPLAIRLVPPGVVTVLFCLSTFGFAADSGSTPADLMGSKPAPASLRGQPLSFLGLRSSRSREVIAVVSDSCHSCSDAKRWLLVHPDLPVRVVRLRSQWEPATKADLTREASSRVASVPRFLYVEGGQIVSDHPGWSAGGGWQLSFQADIKSFLFDK